MQQLLQDCAHIEAEYRTALLLVTGLLGMDPCFGAAPAKTKQSTQSALLQMASAPTTGVRAITMT